MVVRVEPAASWGWLLAGDISPFDENRRRSPRSCPLWRCSVLGIKLFDLGSVVARGSLMHHATSEVHVGTAAEVDKLNLHEDILIFAPIRVNPELATSSSSRVGMNRPVSRVA
jgi:hypothetical protein